MRIEKREDIARLIKSACALRGVTLAKLGEKMGMLPPSVNRAVNRADIGLTRLQAISEALDCYLIIELIPMEDHEKDDSRKHMNN